MVKIAFASEENIGLESRLAYHFGRCQYYIFVEIGEDEVKSVEVKENPFFSSHVQGAVPQFISSEGADVIIAGGMGPRALDWFRRLNIQPITGVSGKIRDVLNDYMSGKIKGAKPCDDHKDVRYQV